MQTIEHKQSQKTTTTHQTAPISQKRKASDKDEEEEENVPGSKADSSQISQGEYETGRVICEVCGEGVSFRDHTTGGFTLRHWNAHRQGCASSSSQRPAAEPVIYTPESTAEAIANPPVKRRRTKRNEDERIEYLRSDPYVAQFEAYRVLCASCNRWIRLRPNSTFCSIPWDAHRKSCLSKKTTDKNSSALDERNTLLSHDPDVRKFDAERIQCDICARWINVHPGNHAEALRQWHSHQASCHASVIASTSRSSRTEGPIHPPITVLPLSEQRARPPTRPSTPSTSRIRPGDSNPPNASSSHTINKGDPAPQDPISAAQDSRRRSAEHRAATLRSDPLLTNVEPNRVFCTMCQKWVQLRQDSTFCAYPWLQHRGKCLAKHQRIAQRSSKMEELKAPKVEGQEFDQLLTDDDTEWTDELAEVIHRHTNPSSHARARQRVDSQTKRKRPRSEKAAVDDGQESTFTNRLTRPHSTSLADFQSPAGRTNFIFASIAYLFTTTYGPSDDMTVSALLTYINSAMPPDKHEDFDTAEVVRAAAALQDRGEITFEGDILRLLH